MSKQNIQGAQQGDPVSAYLFILCLEILFTIVKNNKDIKSPKYSWKYLPIYSICRWQGLKKFGSVKELLNTISLFFLLWGLKPNLSNCLGLD